MREADVKFESAMMLKKMKLALTRVMMKGVLEGERPQVCACVGKRRDAVQRATR